MKLRELILKNRSYRRFEQKEQIERQTLVDFVDLARLSPSGSNLQPLKYIISNDPKKNELIFGHLAWAGYLRDWDGPVEGERPAAYIIILKDMEISQSFGCDHGIAAQSILLAATEQNLGGCIIGSIRRSELAKALQIDPRYEIRVVIALGKPKEQVQLEQVEADGDIRYWRDENDVHHVPKRSLNEIIIG